MIRHDTTRHTTRRDATRHATTHDTTRHGTMRRGMIRRAMTRHYSTRHDTTFVFYTRTSTCASASCFKEAEPHNLHAPSARHHRMSEDERPPANGGPPIAGGRRPPAADLLLLEVVRAPPHTEEPFLPVRTTMTLVVPSWSPSWSLPPPMRAAAPDPRTGDAAPAPSECLSEAHYRLLRHAAVQRRRLLWAI